MKMYFHRVFGLVILAGIILTAGGCAGKILTVPEIVTMSDEGMSDNAICGKIEESGTIYRMKGSQLADLSERGVSDGVIDCMEQTYIEAVRQDQALEDWDNWSMGDDGWWYW